MAEILSSLISAAGGWPAIIAVALSIAANVAQAIAKKKAAAQAAQVRDAAGAIIRGVEAFAPESAAPVKQDIKAESILAGVLDVVQKLVDAETK